MASISDEEIQEIIDGADSKAEAINELFDRGLTKSQVMKRGFKEATVRKEVDRRKKEGREVPGTPPHEGSMFPAITKGTETVLPEYMSQEISEYFDGSIEQQRIFKAGIMVPLLGMRLFSEMVKPLTMLINAMKGDQIEATMKAMALGQQQAHDAAMEASQATAAQILAGQKEMAIASSPNPMATMMMNAAQPAFTAAIQKAMGALMPGFAPPAAESGKAPLPGGWVKKQAPPAPPAE